jgi:hypothetical protein
MTIPNDSVHVTWGQRQIPAAEGSHLRCERSVLLLLLGRNLSDMGLKGTLFLFDDLTMPGITAKS